MLQNSGIPEFLTAAVHERVKRVLECMESGINYDFKADVDPVLVELP